MTNAEVTTNTHAAAVAEQGAHVAPEKATSTKVAGKKKGAPEAKKAPKRGQENHGTKAQGKRAKPAGKKATKVSVPREFSKKAIVLDLLHRRDGATMAEIAKATDWQCHSIRGFISGHITKKMELVVESVKNAQGERTYRIAK